MARSGNTVDQIYSHQPHEHYSVCESMCTNQLCDLLKKKSDITHYLFIAHIQLQCTLQTISMIICSPLHSDMLLSSLPLSQFSGFFRSFRSSSPSSPHLCYRSRNHGSSIQWLSLFRSHISTQTPFHCPFFCTFSSENFNLGVA